MRRWLLAAGCVGIVGITGCDGGISDATPVRTVQAEDLEALCEEQADLLTATEEQYCTLVALGASADEAGCVGMRDACLAAGGPPEAGCAGVGVSDSPDCDASVGELRACWRQAQADWSAVYASASCSLAGSADAPTLADLFADLPAECGEAGGRLQCFTGGE